MVPLLPRLIEEQLGGNEIDIGLNLAMFSVAAMLIRPRLGRFAERHGLRVHDGRAVRCWLRWQQRRAR